MYLHVFTKKFSCGKLQIVAEGWCTLQTFSIIFFDNYGRRELDIASRYLGAFLSPVRNRFMAHESRSEIEHLQLRQALGTREARASRPLRRPLAAEPPLVFMLP